MFDKLRRILRSRAATWCAVGVTLLVFTGGPATAALVQYWTLDSDGANAVTGGNTATIINAAGTEFTSDAPSALAYSTGSVLLTNPAAAPLNQWINFGNIGQKSGNAIFADDPTLTTHGLTVSFWFKANSFNTDMRLFGPTKGDVGPTTFRLSTDPATAPDTAQMQAAGNAWVGMSPAQSVHREQWHHVAYSWSGTVVGVYLDGQAVGGGEALFANYDVEEVGIGHRFRDTYGQHFDGYVDDVAIWDRALMPATIAQLAAGTPPTEISEANAFPFPEYSQVVNIDIDAFRWYPRTDAEGNPIDPEQVFYPDYGGTGILEGIGNTWNEILPNVVASDGNPFGDSEVELIGALDADGTATGINFYASGFEFGWCAPETRNADRLVGDGLVGYPKNTNEWQIDGLTVGETYDLIFYGTGNNTVNITSGADQQAIHWGVPNNVYLVLGEDPADIVEGNNVVRVTITPDASTVTGTFRPDGAAGMRFSGLQIALHGGGVEPLPGDLNGDGMVGSGDLDIVRGNWGQSVDPGCLSCGDPSGDGAVGSADLDIVRANWGQTAAAAVPEPGMSFLLVIGGILLMVRKRWNRTAVLLAVVAAIVIAPSGAFAEIVQYWKLDETDWSYTAANAIVTGNTGSLNAFIGDEWSEDVPAALSYSTGSLEFKREFMSSLDLGDLNLSNLPGTGNAPGVTMSMWIKPTTLIDDTRLFGTQAGVTDPNPSWIRLNADGSAMTWAPSAWYTVGSAGSVQTGQWQNLVATWSNSGMTLFVDGKPVGACGPATFPYTGGQAAISVPFLSTYGFHFDGLVDDLVLWNETLPPSAVKQLAAGTAPEDVSAEFVLPTYSQIVNVDFKFGDLDAYAGKGVIEQAGTTWNEPVISGARNAAGCAATNLVDSQGAATTIDVTCTGFEFGYEPGEGVNVVNHPFTGDRLVAKTTSDNVFEIGGLEVGATYDLFFYGHNQGTIDITAGATAVSGEFVAENYTGVFSMIDDTPEDWIFVEDINYVRLTITPTAASVTGEFNPSEAVSPRMSWCGLQIAKLAPAAVPEPTALVLLFGAAALLIMRRK